MAAARYSVHVPLVDPLGNPLRNVADAAHHYLSYRRPFPVQHVYVDPQKRGRFPHDIVIAHAEETPEADSHMKQLGQYVGELVNHPSVHVAKQGKNGLQAWEIANQLYRPGESAEQNMLAMEPDIAQIGLQHPGEGMHHPAIPYDSPLQMPTDDGTSSYTPPGM